MLDVEREEVECYLPATIEWLQHNAIQRYLTDPDGKVLVDRAWELAALIRWTLIKERVENSK